MTAHWFDIEDSPINLDDFRDPEHAPDHYRNLSTPLVPHGPDEEAFQSFLDVTKYLDLSERQVSSLLKYFNKCQRYTDICHEHLHRQKQHDMSKAFERDREVGGNNLNAAMQAGAKALKKFGSKDLSKELELSGLGRAPAFLKFAARVGQAYDPRKDSLKR